MLRKGYESLLDLFYVEKQSMNKKKNTIEKIDCANYYSRCVQQIFLCANALLSIS